MAIDKRAFIIHCLKICAHARDHQSFMCVYSIMDLFLSTICILLASQQQIQGQEVQFYVLRLHISKA